MPELAVSAEKVGFLIEKMREFDVKEQESDPDSGSNSTDDKMIDVLEDIADAFFTGGEVAVLVAGPAGGAPQIPAGGYVRPDQ